MCYTYDKSKGGDTRELQSRMVPPPKKTGPSHLKKNFGSSGSFNISTSARSAHAIRIIIIIIIIIIKTCSQRL